jgi:hypothetical protein
MDIVTIERTSQQVNCRYAAPSITTGYFVACVLEETPETVVSEFTNPGTLYVHNAEGLVVDKAYTGYTRIVSVDQTDKGVLIMLDKG